VNLYLLFLLMATATVLSPGPGVVMSLTNAMHYGMRDTFAGILGVALGAMFIAAVSATSVGVVLAASATAFTILKYLGAAYLVYLGIRLWRAPAFKFADRPVNEGNVRKRFVEGFALQLTNPKAIFFFLSVFPQFIDPKQNYITQFIILVLTYGTLVVIIHSIYALFAKGAKRWLTSSTGGSVVNKAAGSTFVLFGVMLATAKQ
jgi:homoserine/homoserine lactone efflux protein